MEHKCAVKKTYEKLFLQRHAGFPLLAVLTVQLLRRKKSQAQGNKPTKNEQGKGCDGCSFRQLTLEFSNINSTSAAKDAASAYCIGWRSDKDGQTAQMKAHLAYMSPTMLPSAATDLAQVTVILNRLQIHRILASVEKVRILQQEMGRTRGGQRPG